MNEWSKSSEAIQSMAALSASQCELRPFYKSKSLPAIPPNFKLNTAKVASTLDAILQAESISRASFAKQVVKMNPVVC
jgi:hypothetical protein